MTNSFKSILCGRTSGNRSIESSAKTHEFTVVGIDKNTFSTAIQSVLARLFNTMGLLSAVAPRFENREQCLNVSCVKYLDVTVSSGFTFTEGINLCLFCFEDLACKANPPRVC